MSNGQSRPLRHRRGSVSSVLQNHARKQVVGVKPEGWTA